MHIQTLDDSQIAAALNVIRQSFTAHTELYEARLLHQGNRHTLVAMESDVMAGVATVYRNTLHPNFLNIVLAVLPEYRRRGIGTKLLQAIEAQAALLGDFCGFRMAYFQSPLPVALFLKKHSYDFAHTCRCVEWAAELIAPEFLSAECSGARFLTLADYMAGQGEKKELLEFLWRRYSEEHSFNPPRIGSLQAWEAIALSDVDLDHSLVMLKNGMLAGALTSGFAQANCIEAIWMYVNRTLNFFEDVEGLRQLFNQYIMRCLRSGVQRIALEVDETDERLVALADSMKVLKQEDWLVFFKKIA